ncbi:unnamed protein product [Cladocopium goreaui]|uniref:Ubiquitin-conjugating enzyme E2 2 (E 2 ubiquitin-conjugating enzyme 2) (Mutagen-sensitive protein 8) (Ubiquitin carrier protein ubc2) (Ubiquitin-protein ligase ubc2) n=1 Tax=Cladocopium goreaui TaxID=2562237 RepID=A0A9P1CPR1_9DINO|nr:unnamed protein product [Cladocopium goreaui]
MERTCHARQLHDRGSQRARPRGRIAAHCLLVTAPLGIALALRGVPPRYHSAMELLTERLKHRELDPGMDHPLMLLRFLTCTKTVEEAEEMVLTAQAWRREAKVESIMQEWGELGKDGTWKLAPKKGIQASPVGDDLFNWSAIVLGPQDTAWEGGVWKLKMSFNEEYPEKPPSVRFENEVFHPNIFPDGQICLDLLKGSGWSPAYDVCTILLAIQSLLADPDTHATPEGGANPEAESLFVRDRQGYYAKVKSLVDKQLEEDDMGCLSAVP